MNGLLLSGFPHGIDVAEHLVDGFNAVLHTLFAFVANAFAQLDYFLVLTHLLAKVLNLSIGLLLLQAVVEEEGFPIGGDLLAFVGNQLLVILSGVKRTDVPPWASTRHQGLSDGHPANGSVSHTWPVQDDCSGLNLET